MVSCRALLAALLLAATPASAGAIAITISGVISDSPQPELIDAPFQAVARFSAGAPLSVFGDTRRFFIAPQGGTFSLSTSNFDATGELVFGFVSGGVSISLTPYRPQPPFLGGAIEIAPLPGEAPLPSSPVELSDRLADDCCGGAARFTLTGASGQRATGAILSIEVVPEPGAILLVVPAFSWVNRRLTRRCS